MGHHETMYNCFHHGLCSVLSEGPWDQTVLDGGVIGLKNVHLRDLDMKKVWEALI